MTDTPLNLSEELSLKQKLHSETALIAWHELQRFFAQGVVIVISDSLNLVETAALFADDKADDISSLLNADAIAYPSNGQAQKWYDSDAVLWSVVVAPYVLVQEQRNDVIN